MAVLSDTNRAAVWAKCMQDFSAGREPCALTKAELRAAIDAADAWADANAAAYNLALTVTARNNLTAAQKARILMLVIAKRYEVG